VEEKEGTPAGITDATKVPAPMPGMIISYLVGVDDKVKAGDTLLILEAMKMQNTIASPIDGVVKEISFKPGQSVNTGDTLAVIA